jgi:ubiquinone/menaquinone biosynthesis C-methylase UbiE
MTEQLPAEPPPSPESFGELYNLLAESKIYQRITAEVFGEGYGGQLSIAGPADVRLLATRAALAPGQWVADFCSGMGGPTLLIAAEYGCNMLAVDWSLDALEICRRTAQATELGHRLRYVAGDISRPLFAANSLHAVVSVDGFYFGVDLPWLYREVFRILRPGGRFAFYFNVPTQEVVDASSPERRAHRESHRIDHLSELAAAGFINARREERTFAEQQILARMAEVYETHFEALASEVGHDLATELRDEIVQTLHRAEHGYWPRYLFSARKPGDRPARRR